MHNFRSVRIYRSEFINKTKDRVISWDIDMFYHCVKTVQVRSFFWSVFSHIWTEYRGLLRKFSYSVQIWENKEQKKLLIWILFTQCLFSQVRPLDKKEWFCPICISSDISRNNSYLVKHTWIEQDNITNKHLFLEVSMVHISITYHM